MGTYVKHVYFCEDFSYDSATMSGNNFQATRGTTTSTIMVRSNSKVSPELKENSYVSVSYAVNGTTDQGLYTAGDFSAPTSETYYVEFDMGMTPANVNGVGAYLAAGTASGDGLAPTTCLLSMVNAAITDGKTVYASKDVAGTTEYEWTINGKTKTTTKLTNSFYHYKLEIQVNSKVHLTITPQNSTTVIFDDDLDTTSYSADYIKITSKKGVGHVTTHDNIIVYQ